ncbi:MAG: hypothetical protein H6Q90_6516 [Deltaproteobacteria bacterium]|nr:hypothetical protein [Deltaproteobacteria bacterium]
MGSWWRIAGIAALVPVLASCVPSHGSSRTLVAQANRELTQQDDPVAASKTLARVDANIEVDPDPEAIEVLERLRLQIEQRLIEKAIDYHGQRSGDHFEAMARLHELRKRVLLVKAPSALRDRAAEHLNQRASFAIEAVERAPELPDLKAVLGLGRYPELAADNRRRIAQLLEKGQATHAARAAAASTPIVARLHRGIAALYGGASLPPFDSSSVPAIAAVERATALTVTAPADCDHVGSALKGLERAGGYRVDAEVSIGRCAHDIRIDKRQEPYTVRVTKSRVVQETYTETVCSAPSNERVTVCDSQNCIVTKYWGERSCSQVQRSEPVLEYYEADDTRYREVSQTVHSLAVEGSVVLTVNGVRGATQPWSVTREGAARLDADSPVTETLRALLDAPIQAKRATSAVEHAAASAAANARGATEEAEAEATIALLLGDTSSSVLTSRYPLSIEQLRATFAAGAAALAIAAEIPEEPVEPLEVNRHDYAWLLQTQSALLEPAVGRTGGFNYQTQLGALHATEVTTANGVGAGEWAPTLELRLGTPIIGRLNRLHRLPIGLYDDASASAYLGYRVSGPDTNANKYAVAGGARYTLTVGVRSPVLSFYAGMRATAMAAKLAGTKGVGLAAPWYGQLVFRTGPMALALEVWVPSGIGARAFGATWMGVSRGSRKDGYNGMFGLRFERLALDACADTGAAGCVDVDAVPVTMYSLVLGVGF